MAERIDVRPISGFPEWLPDMRLLEQRVLETIRRTYELYGFTPIETPAVERMEVLTAKGGIERQIYSVGRPQVEEGAGTDLGLHFDLTVPLARYVAGRNRELTFPFRRYQMQKVWRGERAQRGRFREFNQCDIDIVGNGSLDLLHDAEIARLIEAVFAALGVPGIVVHISNRKVLSALAAALGLDGQRAGQVLRTIDKRGTDGPQAVAAALAAAGEPQVVVDAVGAVLGAGDLDAAEAVLVGHGAAVDGVVELRQVVEAAGRLGMPDGSLVVDLAIARGLDYYTGTVYETVVSGHEDWGSVCSGGRYEELAAHFTDRPLPGVGVSIGASRLLDLLTRSGLLSPGPKTPTKVLVTTLDRDRHLGEYLAIAADLRAVAIPAEVYLQPRRLKDQLKYAADLGIPITVIAGGRELERGVVQVRRMDGGEQVEVARGDLVDAAREALLG